MTIQLLKKTLAICLIFLGTNLQAQEIKSISTESKSGLSLGVMRFSTVGSISYNYRLWQNKQATFRTGLQTGIGYGGKLDRYKGFAIPLGVYGELGKKHRIGFDANIVYLVNTSKVPGTIPGIGDVDLNVVFNQGAFTASLYYSYNFGNAQKYNVGIGYNLQSYFGSNYGIENQEPTYFAPFIFFGVRF